MIAPEKKKGTSVGPRSIRGPAGLGLLVVAAAVAAVVVGILPPTFSSKSHAIQAERLARPLPNAITPQPDSETNRGTVSALVALADTVRHETDPTVREERFISLINRLEAEEFPVVMSQLSGLSPGPLGDQLGARIMHRWAENDASAASRWAATWAEGSLRPISLEQVAVVWADQDLARASEWARSLQIESERDDALRMIAHEAVRTEPIAALSMAVELRAGAPRNYLVLRATSEWASTDPQSAADWAQQIADPTLREEVLAGVSAAWGDTDPAAAATLAGKNLSPGRTQANAVVAIVQRWAQTDPRGAARWVAKFPEGTMREDALDNLAKLWNGEVRNDAPGS